MVHMAKGELGGCLRGVSIGFFGVGMTTPTETGEELNCLFDRNTGRLSDYNFGNGDPLLHKA